MSVLIRTELKSSSVVELSSKSGSSRTEQARSSYAMKPVRREDEPLEEALEESEPPESGAREHLEAPDAGEGHLCHYEREFRHGRSRG